MQNSKRVLSNLLFYFWKLNNLHMLKKQFATVFLGYLFENLFNYFLQKHIKMFCIKNGEKEKKMRCKLILLIKPRLEFIFISLIRL